MFAIAAAVTACGRTASAERTDVQAYLERMRAWAPVEAEAARAVERILATEFVDEAEVLHQIEESRPRIVAHVEHVRAYAPRTDRVRAIQNRYVSAWESLLEAYRQIEAGFATGDYTKLARGREAMVVWRDGMLDVARRLRSLAEELDIAPATPT